MKINYRSRFANYSRNMVFALVSQAITVALGFVSRRVFVDELDAVYLGMTLFFHCPLLLSAYTAHILLRFQRPSR